MHYRLSARYLILLVCVLLWAGAPTAAPLLSFWDFAAARVLYAIFTPVCHQLTERSLHLFGFPLAVCARCSGIYFGFLLGLAAWPFLRRPADRMLDRPRLLLLFFLPTLIDLLLPNSAWSRLFTGMIASFPISLFCWIAVEQLFRSAPEGNHHGSKTEFCRSGLNRGSIPRSHLSSAARQPD